MRKRSARPEAHGDGRAGATATLLAIAFACAACAPTGAPARPSALVPATAASALVGTWRLVAFESRAGSEVRHPMGRAVEGQLMYDAGGRVSAHIMRPDRPRFASGDRARGTDDEVRAAFVGYLAYYGTWAADPARGTVTHRIEGATFPDWVGGEQVRHYRVEGGRLVVTTPPMRAAGEQLVTVLVWERLR